MEDERAATISGHKQVLADMLRRKAQEVETGGNAMIIVPGDGGPGLALTFSVESDSYPEFAEPSVAFD